VRGKVGRPPRQPKRLSADRGYDYDSHRCQLRRRGITPEIARRKSSHGSGLGRYCWVVERTLAWLHQFKRLLVRYDRRADIHAAFSRSAAASSATADTGAPHCQTSSKVVRPLGRPHCSARDVASRWLAASVTPRRTMFAQAERHRSSRQPCRRKQSAYPRSTRLPSGRPRFPLCQQAHPVSRARGAALACAR
jgi:transposase